MHMATGVDARERRHHGDASVAGMMMVRVMVMGVVAVTGAVATVVGGKCGRSGGEAHQGERGGAG